MHFLSYPGRPGIEAAGSSGADFEPFLCKKDFKKCCAFFCLESADPTGNIGIQFISILAAFAFLMLEKYVSSL